MGAGAIFVGHMAEMLIPTLLIYAFAYAGAKEAWKLRTGPLVVLGLFVVASLVAGLINATFYVQLNASGYEMISIFLIPLVASVAVIYFLAPRRKETVSENIK